MVNASTQSNLVVNPATKYAKRVSLDVIPAQAEIQWL
jgi:hypothetical protein